MDIIFERIAEPTNDGLRIEDGSSGSGLIYRSHYGIQWIWAEAIPGEPGEGIPFALVYRGDIPDDVIEDLDLDHATIEAICTNAEVDPADYRQLAADPDPAIRFCALQIYAMHYGWMELDHYPQRCHPAIADDLLDRLRIPTGATCEITIRPIGSPPRVGPILGKRQITGTGATPREALEDALDVLPSDIGRGAFLEAASDLPEEEDLEELEYGHLYFVSIRWND